MKQKQACFSLCFSKKHKVLFYFLPPHPPPPHPKNPTTKSIEIKKDTNFYYSGAFWSLLLQYILFNYVLRFNHCCICKSSSETRPPFGKRVSQWKRFFPVGPIYCSQDPQVPSFNNFFFFNLGPMTLFTHLKIILLQCFQFSVISDIQTDPKSFVAALWNCLWNFGL